jgi:hypothetical protein
VLPSGSVESRLSAAAVWLAKMSSSDAPDGTSSTVTTTFGLKAS